MSNEFDEYRGADPESTVVWLMEAPVLLTPDDLPRVAPPVPRRRHWLPALLFLLTCASTFWAGSWSYQSWLAGLTYSGALMTILLCHEFGHFIQARRYGVYASWPHFIPMPLPPIGTMGAVIGMAAHQGDRKALFDIGITGPIAGLIPTLICCVVGIHLSELKPVSDFSADSMQFGEPLLLQWLVQLKFGAMAADQVVLIGPIGMAGWVGLLITALNLMPIGQLDGGHVLYGLLREKAHYIATGLLLAAIAAVIISGTVAWSLMLFLSVLMGPKHPPTADDTVPLGRVRIALGWAMLAFVIIGFTPEPFILE